MSGDVFATGGFFLNILTEQTDSELTDFVFCFPRDLTETLFKNFASLFPPMQNDTYVQLFEAKHSTKTNEK